MTNVANLCNLPVEKKNVLSNYPSGDLRKKHTQLPLNHVTPYEAIKLCKTSTLVVINEYFTPGPGMIKTPHGTKTPRRTAPNLLNIFTEPDYNSCPSHSSCHFQAVSSLLTYDKSQINIPSVPSI